MKKIFLLLILSFFYLLTHSQNLRGSVFDKQNNFPLEGVHVYLSNTKGGTLTNEKGKFSLKIYKKLSQEDTIYFSHIGYNIYKLPFTKKNANEIYLSENVEKLKEVTIKDRNELQTKIHYKTLNPMKKGVYSFGGIINNNKIYIFGGDTSNQKDALAQAAYEFPELSFIEMIDKAKEYFISENYSNLLQIYDIKADKWYSNNLVFKKRAYHNVNYYKNKFYVLGGKRLSDNRLFEYLENNIEVYNPHDNSLLLDNTNPHQAVNFTSFVHDDNLIVLGGSIKEKKSGKKLFVNKVHLYDFKTGLWYDLANMPEAKETNGVLINNKIYLIGGYNNHAVNTIETYDLTNGKWDREGTLFKGIVNPIVASKNNIIYFYEDKNIYTYDTISKELNEYFIDISVIDAEMFISNNTLYIIGGFVEDKFAITPLRSNYSIDLDQFEKTKIFKTKKLSKSVFF